MKNKCSILAIIPARGGSKGMPGKNLARTDGIPLIRYTIDVAKKSKYIDKIIVSTDDHSIADFAVESGIAVPFLRPKKFAKDSSPTSDAVLHAIEWLEKHNQTFDILLLLEPTSPLRKDTDIDAAIELFIKNYDHADALVSVGEVHMEHPYITKRIDHGFVKPLFPDLPTFHQRQQLPKVYFPYGVIYISKVATYKKAKTFYQEKTIPYYIERWQNYEVDDLYDLLCIERIMSNRQNQYLKPNVFRKPPLTGEIMGKNIILKEFSDENLYDKRYLKWLHDREVIKTIGRSEYFTPVAFSDVETYVRELQQSENDYFFALYTKKDNQFIGTAKIKWTDWYNKTADIGIMIGEKSYWGRGLATDTMVTLCSIAFNKLNLRRLTGGCLTSNIAMIKCLEHIGFVKEGLKRRHNLIDGFYIDNVIYGLFKSEFHYEK